MSCIKIGFLITHDLLIKPKETLTIDKVGTVFNQVLILEHLALVTFSETQYLLNMKHDARALDILTLLY